MLISRSHGRTLALLGVGAALFVLWLAAARREAKVAKLLEPTPSIFLASKDRVPCDHFTGISVAASPWITNAAAEKGGWSAPQHTIASAGEQIPARVVETSRGSLVLVQRSDGGAGSGGVESGYAHWLALVEPGLLDIDHAPRAIVQRAELRGYSPFLGEIGGGFYAANGAEGGVLEKLDPNTLVTLRKRTNVGPRPGGSPALSYFTPDGTGGLFFLSYGDVGTRVHHVDANLDDVVPAHFFTAPIEEGEHWNPGGLGLAADRVCVELSCWKTAPPGVLSSDCGKRWLVLDRAFEPVIRDVPPAPIDPKAGRVRWLAYAAAAVFLLLLGYLLRLRSSVRALGRAPTEAEVVRVDEGDITLRSDDGVTSIAKNRLVTLFTADITPGPCVIAAPSATQHGYRGAPPADAPAAPVAIAPGTLADVGRRATQRLTRALIVACALELAFGVLAAETANAKGRTPPPRVSTTRD